MVTQNRNNLGILLLLGSLCVVTPFAIDMYLPAFSRMAMEFHRSTPEISLSLSTYFIGFALGQLIYGPLLDRFGRKRPLYVGLIIYSACSVGCAVAPDLRTLVVLRFFEAMGGCVAQVGALAMVRDFFPVKESAKVFSLLFLMIGVSPLLAPTVGSIIVSSLGWRWIFVILAVIAAVILAVTIFLLPEGHEPDHSVLLRPKPILMGFWNIFRHPQFLTYTLAGAFSFAGLFTFVAGSPVIFMDQFHLSTRAFGVVFAGLVMGFIGGNQLNVVMLRRSTSQQIFLTALCLQVAIGLTLLAGMLNHAIGFATTLVLFFAFLLCIGLTYPNGAALGLAPFSKEAGRASALLSTLQTGTGAIISMSIAVIGSRAVIPLLTLTPLIALALLLIGKKRIGNPVETVANEPVLLH